VFDNLTEKGYFYDPIMREVEIVFIPSLLEDMDRELKQLQLSHVLVDGNDSTLSLL
jgi:hypothetical protein